MALVRLILCLLVSTGTFAQVTFIWEGDRVAAVSFPGQQTDYEGEYSIKAKGAGQSLAGSWSFDQELTFKPAILFTPGNEYIFEGTDTFIFTIPARTSSAVPTVTLIPENDTLPENHLKVYIVFDMPMNEGKSTDFLELWDLTEGREVEKPFLDLSPELWNYESDSLTLWFDPGRVKRDLIPNRKLGPVLKAGHQYEIRLQPGMLSAQGVPVTREYHKTFVAGAADRSSPVTSKWQISTPTRNTRESLNVLFDEPMDPVTVLNYTEIRSESGNKIAGSLRLSDNSESLIFVPLNNWETGVYKITFYPEVEDFAGNRFNRLFDHEGPASPEKPVDFTIRIE